MAERTRRGLKWMGAPGALYLAIFVLLNPHLPGLFSSHLYFGGADGYQNVWNLWWVNQALGEIGTQPWFTSLLHYPGGTTLIGHTLNPFNGLIAMPLLTVMTMVQAYNSIVVFSFVAGGVTAFWLCWQLTRSYAGSLVGGAVFTFSSLHFMHADAHLQLTALQWLPLFVLCWVRFCDRPTPGRGIISAFVLWLVALCDLYYFAYCVFTGALLVAWQAWRRRDGFFLFRRPLMASLAAFLVPATATSGVLAGALVLQQVTDPLLGTHDPRVLSMDLLSPFVWGYYSAYRDSVEPLWRGLSAYVTEASVYVGLSVLTLCVYAWRQRPRLQIAHLPFWIGLAAFFFVMALGPNLHIGGHEISLGLRGTFMGQEDVNFLALPYAVLWLLFPPWRLAGVPLRMMVMVQLVAAIVSAGAIQAMLTSGRRWRRAAVAGVLVVILLDYWPAPFRVTDTGVPDYVTALRQLPEGPVLDLASNAAVALYYQTIHQKPIAFGYVSRMPLSVDAADQALVQSILAGQWDQIARDYGYRYVVKRDRAADLMIRGLNNAALPEIDPARRVYEGDGVAIYRY